MLSAVFAILFGLSLLPGRKPLCLRFAERMSAGILPTGAEGYCRRLTWIWFGILATLAGLHLACVLCGCGPSAWVGASGLSLLVVPATFFIEKRIRDRRFSVTFRTSGSTGGSKTIVKTFESLAREVAYHRDFHTARLRAAGGTEERPVRLLATIDPGHMFGTLWRVMFPAAMGFSADDEIIRAPEALLEKMKTAGKVFLVTTPSFLDRFTAYADLYDVPQNCVEIVTSGALLAKDVSDRAKTVFGVEPRQIFGSTETGGVAWRRGDGAWRVFPAVKVRAARTAAGAPARLAVRSPYSFRKGWYVMGDGAEVAADGRTFRLLGRVDRLVKINEERVNLAELEEKIRALGYVDCALAALDGDRGPFLGCVLVPPSGLPSSRRPNALALRRRLLPLFPKGAVPKRFRLVHELPRNAQGKVLNAEIVRLLESALVEPAMRNVRRTADAFTAEVTFDPAASYFRGHFPSAPILPGVVQLGFAERCAERLRGTSGALKGVKKMKFVHIIEPDVEVTLRIVRTGEDEFTYEYRRGEVSCASGVLVF
ncbi:MAG: AMP-binding protein [Kiritimatiellia bacterium]